LAQNRFFDFLHAKSGFYSGEHKMFKQSDMGSLTWSQDFQPSDLTVDGQYAYKDRMHKGVDISGPAGTDLFAYYGGRVEGERANTTSSGYSVVIEHGFDFENAFYSTGVFSQFMHLKSDSPLKPGDMVTGTTKIGDMGNSGLGTGTHLHYQLMGDLGGTSYTSSQWDMYQQRRNTLLVQSGLIPASDYSIKKTYSSNYYSVVEDYRNFYYNVNAMREIWGL
jgi:murein DD-endopeptidase MepM/ murein hydrolase activator NlpD